ncbi:MAG: hypothetical protein WAZ97_16790 [Pseudolabrys sp.]
MTTISAAILTLSASHLSSTVRAELYGEAYMLRHDRALSLQNIPDFLRLLDGYRIQATLLAHLRRRPLPCSIGFPTGNAPMPTTWP